MTPWSWVSRAACRGSAIDFCGPEGERQADREARERRAKAVCAGRPVAAACLAYALESREAGVWGGTTDDERSVLRRRASRAALTAARRAERALPGRLKQAG